MKFKLMQFAQNYSGKTEWRQAVSALFDGNTPEEAEAAARRQILWLSSCPNPIRMDPASGISFGAQLWEPCECCGTEPSYAQPTGHLCAKCAAVAHLRVSLPRHHNTTEPGE